MLLTDFPRYKERWSDREDKILLQLRATLSRRFSEASAIYRVALQLGRTPAAVQKRLEILALVHRIARR